MNIILGGWHTFAEPWLRQRTQPQHGESMSPCKIDKFLQGPMLSRWSCKGPFPGNLPRKHATKRRKQIYGYAAFNILIILTLSAGGITRIFGGLGGL